MGRTTILRDIAPAAGTRARFLLVRSPAGDASLTSLGAPFAFARRQYPSPPRGAPSAAAAAAAAAPPALRVAAVPCRAGPVLADVPWLGLGLGLVGLI